MFVVYWIRSGGKCAEIVPICGDFHPHHHERSSPHDADNDLISLINKNAGPEHAAAQRHCHRPGGSRARSSGRASAPQASHPLATARSATSSATATRAAPQTPDPPTPLATARSATSNALAMRKRRERHTDHPLGDSTKRHQQRHRHAAAPRPPPPQHRPARLAAPSRGVVTAPAASPASVHERGQTPLVRARNPPSRRACRVMPDLLIAAGLEARSSRRRTLPVRRCAPVMKRNPPAAAATRAQCANSSSATRPRSGGRREARPPMKRSRAHAQRLGRGPPHGTSASHPEGPQHPLVAERMQRRDAPALDLAAPAAGAGGSRPPTPVRAARSPVGRWPSSASRSARRPRAPAEERRDRLAARHRGLRRHRQHARRRASAPRAPPRRRAPTPRGSAAAAPRSRSRGAREAPYAPAAAGRPPPAPAAASC